MAEYEDVPDAEVVDKEDDGPLFVRNDGKPIKFHIQSDISPPIVDDLKKYIDQAGGEVLKTIPREGYVLVDPSSEKGDQMIARWTDPNKPDRHVLCYTWVWACAFESRVVPAEKMTDIQPIFIQDGAPVAIYIDQSIGKTRKDSLTKKIILYGGYPTPDKHESKVIISDDSKGPAFRSLVEKHENVPFVYVEPLSWVKECINAGGYGHRPRIVPSSRKLPGRKPGARRNDYSMLDDKLLTEYLATNLPTESGRAGNRIYQDLCEQLDLYPWASNHTWQSWRNRYVNDKGRFNAAINKYLRENRSRPKSKPKPTPSPKKRKKTPAAESIRTDSDEFEQPPPPPPPLPKSNKKRKAADDGADTDELHANGARKTPRIVEDEAVLTAEQMMFKHLGLKSPPRISSTSESGPSSGLASSTTRVSGGSKGKEKVTDIESLNNRSSGRESGASEAVEVEELVQGAPSDEEDDVQDDVDGQVMVDAPPAPQNEPDEGIFAPAPAAQPAQPSSKTAGRKLPTRRGATATRNSPSDDDKEIADLLAAKSTNGGPARRTRAATRSPKKEDEAKGYAVPKVVIPSLRKRANKVSEAPRTTRKKAIQARIPSDDDDDDDDDEDDPRRRAVFRTGVDTQEMVEGDKNWKDRHLKVKAMGALRR